MLLLEQLYKKCEGSVYISINEHKNNYSTIQESLNESCEGFYDKEQLTDEIVKEMIKRDSFISIQFYPNSPNGFHAIAHYDFEEALNIALSYLT